MRNKNSINYLYGKKYHNIRQTYGGYSYDSKLEANKAFELDMLKKAKEIDSFDRQVRCPLYVNKIHVCDYYIDFVVYHNGKIHPKGTIEYLETKGFQTSLWRLKWKIFTATYNKKGVVFTIST